jgi:hypothetical protein
LEMVKVTARREKERQTRMSAHLFWECVER